MILSVVDTLSGDRQLQRSDGVMSVEVLGLGSADPRRRSSGDVFYNRAAVPHHDVLVSSMYRYNDDNIFLLIFMTLPMPHTQSVLSMKAYLFVGFCC